MQTDVTPPPSLFIVYLRRCYDYAKISSERVVTKLSSISVRFEKWPGFGGYFPLSSLAPFTELYQREIGDAVQWCGGEFKVSAVYCCVRCCRLDAFQSIPYGTRADGNAATSAATPRPPGIPFDNSTFQPRKWYVFRRLHKPFESCSFAKPFLVSRRNNPFWFRGGQPCVQVSSGIRLYVTWPTLGVVLAFSLSHLLTPCF